jgi:hypothetical protein
LQMFGFSRMFGRENRRGASSSAAGMAESVRDWRVASAPNL